jgi:septal ring factor EnvC (AmiA/AmiB activator)
MEATFISEILKTTPTLAPMLLLVWWLKGAFDKSTTNQELLVNELNSERKDRLDGMEAQINKLEVESKECQKDRLNLHRENAAMQERIDTMRASKTPTQ